MSRMNLSVPISSSPHLVAPQRGAQRIHSDDASRGDRALCRLASPSDPPHRRGLSSLPAAGRAERYLGALRRPLQHPLPAVIPLLHLVASGRQPSGRGRRV